MSSSETVIRYNGDGGNSKFEISKPRQVHILKWSKSERVSKIYSDRNKAELAAERANSKRAKWRVYIAGLLLGSDPKWIVKTFNVIE